MATYGVGILQRVDMGSEIVEYLDTGKVGARSVAGELIMFSRPGPELDYWEGEE